ncbi:putative toxin-antitoxin system toxin component, PIN family [Nostoc cf. edaphicum LEGE 07299]|uniref:Toxin-antitoxin system toxin component, PIN family n=1 Tax=Nostoc cf. edaphicum LEGE 07299 TaxID=2777974 RepID=A0ABR9U2L9_9NOSO|nr:putative toxin-antitoxin system toxin component, PIN family [Nostoc edaphicum]MBE9106848.1 putative toxin-antitoxin system toxin component, PIN family [Nostoc cf. edaphicum LEGE 07299]
MRVVVDVNIWISALLWGGVPDKVVILAQEQTITIFASDALFQELETTLRRPKFQSKIQSLNLNLEDVINATKDVLEFCPTISVDAPQLRDPKDTVVLAVAVAANAEAIVTGDLDLLVLIEFNGIPILTPQDFLSRYFLD